MKKIPVICTGCGAPLHGPVCEFCGREYNLNEKMEVKGDVYFDRVVEVTFMGKKVQMYVGNIEIEPIYSEACRDVLGNLHTVHLRRDPIMRLTLVSM